MATTPTTTTLPTPVQTTTPLIPNSSLNPPTTLPPTPDIPSSAALPPSSGPPSPPSPPTNGGMSKDTLTALVVGIAMGGVIVLIAVGIFVFFYKRNKRKQVVAQQQENHNQFDNGHFVLPKYNPFPGQAQQYHNNAPHPGNNMVHQQQKPDPPPGRPPNLLSSRPQVSVAPMPPSTSGSVGSDYSHPSYSTGGSLPYPNSTFTYEELALATDNFSSANLLGQGGFGYVHKGVLPNGKEVAVKQLKSGSVQGEREFQAEVETISRVHHRHLVSLVGYCMCGEQRMLVYEFISNKTMEFHLHEGIPPMNWATRLRIALGAAKGLAYLHEDCHPKVIHRDIKAANILIDDEFEAKVADFGLAKFSLDTDTHVSTRVMGTFGYLAPEYASSGKLTEKSDVFSFGVVLLELITGRRPVDKARPFMDDSMVEWARPLLMQALEGGSFIDLVDSRIEYDSAEMAQMVACAAVCVRSSARRRPLMSQVVRALEGNLSAEDLLKEIAPDNRTFHGSSDYDSSVQYKQDMKRFRKLALESQEQSTGEYSVFTGDHGAPPSTSSTENQPDTQEIETGKSKKDSKDVLEIPVE